MYNLLYGYIWYYRYLLPEIRDNIIKYLRIYRRL